MVKLNLCSISWDDAVRKDSHSHRWVWLTAAPSAGSRHLHPSSPGRSAAAAGPAGGGLLLQSEVELETHKLCPVESENKKMQTNKTM